MGDLLLEKEMWDELRLNCPCCDTLNMLCSAKHGQMEKVKCEYLMCPFVFWLNMIVI